MVEGSAVGEVWWKALMLLIVGVLFFTFPQKNPFIDQGSKVVLMDTE